MYTITSIIVLPLKIPSHLGTLPLLVHSSFSLYKLNHVCITISLDINSVEVKAMQYKKIGIPRSKHFFTRYMCLTQHYL